MPANNFIPNLSRVELDRLRLGYTLAVICAAMFIAFQALVGDPYDGPWIKQGWEPSIGFSAFLSLAVVSLVFTLRRPVWCLCAYLLVEHSSRRYGAELGYIYAYGLTEWMALLGGLGSYIWAIGHPKDSNTPSKVILGMVALLFLWAMFSTGVALFHPGQEAFEIRHHPVRYLDGLILCFAASIGITARRDYQLMVAILILALLWRCLASPQTLYRDGDIGELVAIALPLTVIIALLKSHWALRALAAAASIGLIGLIFVIQSRGAAVGLVAGIGMLWILSFHRWRMLALSLPLLLLCALLLYSSGFWGRIAESLPGGASYSSIEGRFYYWNDALEMSRDNPLIGVGPGNYALRMEEYNKRGGSGKAAHSNYLSVLSELGIPGLLLYLSVLFGTCILTARQGRRDPYQWPCPEARAVCASLTAYMGAGAFVSRHDQALFFILVGTGAALVAKMPATAK